MGLKKNCFCFLAKYPYLQIRSLGQEEGSRLLEFGSVAIGSCLEKHFEIYNPSSVSHFDIPGQCLYM